MKYFYNILLVMMYCLIQIYTLQYFLNKHYKIHDSINEKDSMIIYPSIILKNKSNGLFNFHCIKSNNFLTYHSNRKKTSQQNALLPIILWYSSKILEKAFNHAIELIKSLCHPKNELVVYAILSIDENMSHLLSNYSYVSTQNCKKYKLCEYFLNLDYTYKLYSIGEDYKCSLIYGCIKQNYFSTSFIKSTILTPHNECVFAGRYASAVNLYPALPFMLKIFDYFDYVIKYDIDNKINNVSLDLELSSIVNQKFELAGCNIVSDNIILSSNIFKMLFMYLSNLSMKCKDSIFGRGFSQNFIHNENIVLHGRLTISWLGLYNSPEVYDFLKYYLSYKDGIYKYRWGDQQFYLNTLLLFSSKNKLGFSTSKLCKMHDIKMF